MRLITSVFTSIYVLTVPLYQMSNKITSARIEELESLKRLKGGAEREDPGKEKKDEGDSRRYGAWRYSRYHVIVIDRCPE